MSATPLYCVVGAGYVGRRLANALAAGGHRLIVTRRNASASPPDANGLKTIAVDLDSDKPIGLPNEALAILYLVPPAPGEPDPRLVHFLDALGVAPERFVLAGSSGVYGDCGGARVDEATPPRPTTERAVRRLGQERLLTRWAGERAVRYSILRISGIYGPGRLPIDRLRRGEPVIAESEAYPGNRIHVDDLVAVALAALTRPDAQGIYNVADGNHASGTAFYKRIAELAGLPLPVEVSRETARRDFSATRYSFLADSRRLDTRRLRDDLGVELKYTDLDEGIKASLPGASLAGQPA